MNSCWTCMMITISRWLICRVRHRHTATIGRKIISAVCADGNISIKHVRFLVYFNYNWIALKLFYTIYVFYYVTGIGPSWLITQATHWLIPLDPLAHHIRPISSYHWIHWLIPLDPLAHTIGPISSYHWIHCLIPLDSLAHTIGPIGSIHWLIP